jgi:DNA polymerase III alpha subunit (gram-positive type)
VRTEGTGASSFEDAPLYRLPLVAIDFETTGLAAYRGDKVCEVGLVAAEGERTNVLLSTFVDPGVPLSEETRELTGIQASDLVGAPSIGEVVQRLIELIGTTPLVMHNAPFDLQFLLAAIADSGLRPIENLAIDTLLMARFLDRNPEGNSLRSTANRYGISQGRAHRAADDALTAALAYHSLVPYFELRGIRTLGQLVHGRMAGPAHLFVDRVSSVLIDLAARAVAEGRAVDILYAARPGSARTDPNSTGSFQRFSENRGNRASSG